MQNQKYEQPKLQLVSLALNDVLLASTQDPDDPAGELDSTYTVRDNSICSRVSAIPCGYGR